MTETRVKEIKEILYLTEKQVYTPLQVNLMHRT